MPSRGSGATSLNGRGAEAWAGWRDLPRPERLRILALIAWIGVLTLLFIQPLVALFAHAREHSLHSHTPLVPVIAAYLLYTQPHRDVGHYRTSALGTVLLCSVALLALVARMSLVLSMNDALALMTLAYISSIAAGGFLFLGARWMAGAAFPVGFLIFIVPLPDAAVYWLERGSVLASAEVAALFFNMTGTLLIRSGTIFELPGITLEVAQECSGIRSSFVLFITSVLASHLFLKSGWRRVALVAFVIPLGIIRNGFRILVIGLLTVHIGPHMIDSPIHHSGGPVFFVLSLVPFLLFLIWLRRGERQSHTVREPAPADTR